MLSMVVNELCKKYYRLLYVTNDIEKYLLNWKQQHSRLILWAKVYAVTGFVGPCSIFKNILATGFITHAC